MTAVNPMQPTAPPARDQRGYEPSMEEILASIRRIIADDQSLPGRPPAAETPGLAEPAPPSRPPALPDVHVLRPVDGPTELATPIVPAAIERPIVPVAAPMTRETATKPEAPVEPPSFAAHGTIAPQFATPEGPVVPHDPPQAAPLREEPEQASADGHEVDRSHESNPKSAASRATDQAIDYDKPLGRHEPIPFEPASLISPSTDHAMVAAFNMLAASRLTENTEELLAMTRDMIRPLLKTWLDDNLPSMVERLVRAEIERAARGSR